MSELPKNSFADVIAAAPISMRDTSFRPRPATDNSHSLVRTVQAALLSETANELARAERQPDEPANEMERAVLKSMATERENAVLRQRLEELDHQLKTTINGNAAETLRLRDLAEMYQKSAADLQQQRDIFANYAIELRTRTEGLLTVMAANADAVETTIRATIDTIEQDINVRVSNLRTMMSSNAKTARAMISDALAVAASDTVVQLHKRNSAA